MEVSKNADCLGSAGAATEATSKAAYCAEDACVAYMTNVEARLPNCSYSGYNIKQVVADALAVCRDNTVTWPPNATTPTATTATLLPTTTTQTPTAAPSADSQTTDTPAVTTSAAVALKSNAHIVMLTLAVVLAWVGL
ncbi:hypothetical protein PI126_g19975 [Phytophthora idaei]|nr:hypothetical protein PI126_g19975 [Phytophthora idaei]